MTAPKTAYRLEIHQLLQPYKNMDSLQKSTPLHTFESPTPFATFQVGQTLSRTRPTKYLGTVQHVHQWVGEDDDGVEMLHRTIVYVFGIT